MVYNAPLEYLAPPLTPTIRTEGSLRYISTKKRILLFRLKRVLQHLWCPEISATFQPVIFRPL